MAGRWRDDDLVTITAKPMKSLGYFKIFHELTILVLPTKNMAMYSLLINSNIQ